jgi:hypothetical protein
MFFPPSVGSTNVEDAGSVREVVTKDRNAFDRKMMLVFESFRESILSVGQDGVSLSDMAIVFRIENIMEAE